MYFSITYDIILFLFILLKKNPFFIGFCQIISFIPNWFKQWKLKGYVTEFIFKW